MAGASALLGSAVGVRRGWRPKALLPGEVLTLLGGLSWLEIERKGELVAHRAWQHRGAVRRIDAAFADGSCISFRRHKSGFSVRLWKWRRG